MPNYKHCSQSQVVFSQLMLPSHSNFGGKIHGGYILSLMDQIAFACASKHSGYYCVTASVGSVDFLNPIDIGELVTMRASVNHVGRSSMVIGIRVESENVQTGEVKHCNSSYFTMVAKKDDPKNTLAVPGLILRNENDLRRFLKALRQKEQAGLHEKRIEGESFRPEKHREELKQHNVKLDFD